LLAPTGVKVGYGYAKKVTAFRRCAVIVDRRYVLRRLTVIFLAKTVLVMKMTALLCARMMAAPTRI